MTRIELIPLPTADGRGIVLQAVPVTARGRLRRLARRLAARRR